MRMIGEMRRLTSLLAAALLVAGPLATTSGAMAGGRHEGRGEQRSQQQAPRGGNRAGENGRWGGGAGRGGPPPQVYRGGGEYRGGGRSGQVDPRGEYRGEQRVDPRYDPRANSPPPNAYGGAPRRGGYLGPNSDGGPIQDYAAHRLRPPPRGYEWVRTPGGMALVSQSTRQVFDVVPY